MSISMSSIAPSTGDSWPRTATYGTRCAVVIRDPIVRTPADRHRQVVPPGGELLDDRQKTTRRELRCGSAPPAGPRPDGPTRWWSGHGRRTGGVAPSRASRLAAVSIRRLGSSASGMCTRTWTALPRVTAAAIASGEPQASRPSTSTGIVASQPPGEQILRRRAGIGPCAGHRTQFDVHAEVFQGPVVVVAAGGPPLEVGRDDEPHPRRICRHDRSMVYPADASGCSWSRTSSRARPAASGPSSSRSATYLANTSVVVSRPVRSGWSSRLR